ncbi:MAG: TlpA family protein disulfide reductase, partial [Acidimicrobiales bacterium]
VAVFTSATCGTCAGVWERAQPLASDAVAVQQLEHSRDRALHERYGIDAVPATLVVDAEGVVAASFIGPVTATDLWAAVAEARDPGSTPPECHPA